MPNTYTPHYNLAKPESGTVNWDDEINGNFDIIDTALHTLQTTLTSHVTNTNNPHNTVYYQVGAAPAVHTHPGSSITSPVAQANNADKVDGYDANDFVQKATASTITAQHTFNPPSTGAPFILGTNAQGQLVTGLNADKVDGYDANDFVQKATASTITAQHTFNPPSTGAPFILGTNAQGQLVTGLNADKVDGYDANDFVQKATASTITAQHTFNPPSTGAPFILGTNAQGQLVTGLNADKVDGYDR